MGPHWGFSLSTFRLCVLSITAEVECTNLAKLKTRHIGVSHTQFPKTRRFVTDILDNRCHPSPLKALEPKNKPLLLPYTHTSL